MWTVDAVLTGRIARLTDEGETSAIAKKPVDHFTTFKFISFPEKISWGS